MMACAALCGEGPAAALLVRRVGTRPTAHRGRER